MKTTAFSSLILALAAPLCFAETAMEIVEKHDGMKADALEAYLKANPKAEDRNDAIDALVEARMVHDKTDGLLPYVKEKYTSLDKKKPGTGRDVFMTTQAIIELMTQSGDAAGAKAFLEKVFVDIEDSPEEQPLSQALEHLESTLSQPQVGQTMDLAFTDINGKDFNLSDLKGKVVLVDFWATWCGPCVAELPHVKEAYGEYHEKGFEIVGISLDQEKSALTKFIKDNEMPWVQYFDGKGWENTISTKFGITSIPATYLIGKDGKIIDRDLRGAALGAAIEKALN